VRASPARPRPKRGLKSATRRSIPSVTRGERKERRIARLQAQRGEDGVCLNAETADPVIPGHEPSGRASGAPKDKHWERARNPGVESKFCDANHDGFWARAPPSAFAEVDARTGITGAPRMIRAQNRLIKSQSSCQLSGSASRNDEKLRGAPEENVDEQWNSQVSPGSCPLWLFRTSEAGRLRILIGYCFDSGGTP